MYGSNLEDVNKTGEIYTNERHKGRGELTLKLLSATGILVSELRLETTLVDEEDVKLLSQLFAVIPQVTKCYLDIVRFEDVGLLSLPSNLFRVALASWKKLRQFYSNILPHFSH